MKNGKKGLVQGIVLLALSALLAAGSKVWFHACAPMEDGSYMTCHYAEQVSAGLGIALLVLSLLSLIQSRAAAKRAYAISMIPVAILTMLVPNVLIPLCMMPEMQCRAVMKPAVLVLSVLIAVTALIAGLTVRDEEA